MGKDFTETFLVERSPQQVFDVVLDVRSWWQGFHSEHFAGKCENMNDEFTFRAGDGAHYSRQRLIEMIPGKRVVWLVTESRITFVTKHDEWDGTKIKFEITAIGDKTQLQFTHEGLTPEIDCYGSCSTAWTMYLREKLLTLISSQTATAI